MLSACTNVLCVCACTYAWGCGSWVRSGRESYESKRARARARARAGERAGLRERARESGIIFFFFYFFDNQANMYDVVAFCRGSTSRSKKAEYTATAEQAAGDIYHYIHTCVYVHTYIYVHTHL